MCFSASADFVGSAVLGAVGVATDASRIPGARLPRCPLRLPMSSMLVRSELVWFEPISSMLRNSVLLCDAT